MKFFSDIKPIIKAQEGANSSSFIPKDKLAGDIKTGTTVVPTSLMTTNPLAATNKQTTSTTEEPKVKIYLSSDGTQHTNSINNPNHQKLIAAGWTVVNSIPKGDFNPLKMGSYIPKDKWKGSTNFDGGDGLLGGKKDEDKKGLTFSDLRALNATAANKIERVPQSMPVGQMTRVDPLGRSQAIDKQKQDAQANANAARMRGPQGSDPTLNVLQNLSTTAQVNEQTAKANMMQGENLSNQRDRQRQQVENANLIETKNQNVRIGLRNAQEREMAQKKTQQRVTNAQIGNTWLGEKEGEQKAGIFADTQLTDRYVNLAMQQDPDYVAKTEASKEATLLHYTTNESYKDAYSDLITATTQLKSLEGTDPRYEAKKKEVDELTKQVADLKAQTESAKTDLTTKQQATQDLRNKYEKNLLLYQRDVNKNSSQAGGAKTEDSFNRILGPLLNPKTPIKKKGGSMSMADRLYLEDVRQMNKIELQRNKEMAKSFVLPEPKAYFLSMQMMVAQNKAITDMVKDIYKTIYGGNKKR